MSTSRSESLLLLSLINEARNRVDLIRQAAAFFQSRSGCEAVAIRLRDGKDFPYFEARGFPADFLLRENSLCARDERGNPVADGSGEPVLECMCGCVLSGRVCPDKPFFTTAGSFWTNSTTQLLASTSERDRPARTRNRCPHEGFESVALIPLRHAGSTLGLIQLNDRRRDCFTASGLERWEGLALQLATAVARYQAEEAVSFSEHRYRGLFNEMNEGFALQQILCKGDGEPCDYRFLEVNPAFLRLAGKRRDEVVGRLQSEVLPGENSACVRLYGDVATTGRPVRFDHFSSVLQTTFEVFAYCPEPGQVAALYMNVSERKRNELVLKHTIDELALLNEDLEQFVNVASHDLKEPLRMVTAFLGLLQERAGDRLDGPLREYMTFASGAAGRMQRLIDDLLAYARLGRGDCRETVPADALVDEALAGVRLRLIETEAEVTREPLPEVNGNRTELTLVFQNLIGNALKFRKGRKPRIRVRASRVDRFWRFSISDNGIGIRPEHREKIFLIFERLPTEEPCEGSGMGLAICRKIVERHGGRIWVDSEPGLGSDFHFTLPVREGAET